jgi:TM2 domain-containing membrane protein YozV
MLSQRPPANTAAAYLLWGLGWFGLCGIHRFYLGKPVSGAIWLLTFGLGFVGQFIDIFLIPDMVAARNLSLLKQANINGYLTETEQKEQENLSQPLHQLLAAAATKGNVLSLGQAILATKLPPDAVQELLDEAIRRGLAEVGNDPETGAVRYYFDI